MYMIKIRKKNRWFTRIRKAGEDGTMGDVIHKRINENQPAVMKQPTKESGLTFKLDCRFSRVGLCPRKAPERLPYRRLGNHFSRRRLLRWNKTHKRELGTGLLFLALQIQAVIETNLRNVTVLGCRPSSSVIMWLPQVLCSPIFTWKTTSHHEENLVRFWVWGRKSSPIADVVLCRSNQSKFTLVLG